MDENPIEKGFRLGTERKRHEESIAVQEKLAAIELRKIELLEKEVELREKDLKIREKDHEFNAGRDWREKRLFGIAVISISISVAAFILSWLSFWISSQ